MDFERIRKNFESHGFQTTYFETKEEAADYLADTIKNRKVGFGGSLTSKTMGLYEKLGKENTVSWHWMEPGRETLLKAREADIYICSANGVSETGEIVNIDGTGNRVSMTLFGPEKVYFVVGVNKLAPDLHGAIARAKNVAAPKNAVRFQKNTPCALGGEERCYDCLSPERICHSTVILERPSTGMEAEVVFINEELGY